MTKTHTVDVQTIGFSSWFGQPKTMVRSHMHDEIELNFVERGHLVYLLGGKHLSISAGQLAIFWAAMPHQLIHQHPLTTLHWMTVPLGQFLRWQLPPTVVTSVLQGRLILEPEDAQATRDLASFRQWHTDLNTDSVEHHRIVLLEVEARLRRLALSVDACEASPARGGNVVPDVHGDSTTAHHMARYIVEHYTESLRVEAIARSAGLHPNYAMSLFRTTFGISLIEYVTQHRVAHAQRLLVTSNASVLEIAFDSGFESSSRFYAAFKRACGCSPRAYRAALFGRSQASG